MSTVAQFIDGAAPGEAFTNAQENARYEYGHNGRTGTIAEAPDYEVLEVPPLLDWSALHSAQTLIERDRVTYGDVALLLPVAQPLARKNVTAVVDVAGMDEYDRNSAINDAITKKLGFEQSIYEVEVNDHTAPDGSPRGKFRTKPYEVKLPTLSKDRRTLFHVYADDVRVASFPTITEARRHMKAHAKEMIVPCRLTVRGEVARLDGGPLYIAGRQVSQESVHVKARVALPRQAPITRWVAVGSYLSEQRS